MQNISNFSLPFTLLVIISTLGCSKQVLVLTPAEQIETSELIQSRRTALKEEFKVNNRPEYKILRRNTRKIITTLSEYFNQQNITIDKISDIHLVDNYEIDTRIQGGVLWFSSWYFLYRIDLDANKIVYFKAIEGEENYPPNADVHIKLIKFLTNASIAFEDHLMPATGRSHNGYCIYSQINVSVEGNTKIVSRAFRQW